MLWLTQTLGKCQALKRLCTLTVVHLYQNAIYKLKCNDTKDNTNLSLLY